LATAANSAVCTSPSNLTPFRSLEAHWDLLRVTANEKARPYYFTRWYYCQNSQCDTALIMPEAFKVVERLFLVVGGRNRETAN
jgi:hypothetical protein